MRRWLSLGLLCATSCAEDPARIIILPSGDEEPIDCLTILHEEMIPEADSVLSVAADGLQSEGAWALVLDDPEPEDPGRRVFLARQPDQGEAPVEPLDLGFVLNAEETLRLWPGEHPGRAYLLRQSASKADLWVADKNEGLVAAGSLASIPGVGLIADWDRHVVFLDAQPYVIAVPKRSETLSLRFYAAALDDNLYSATVWELPFVHPCESDHPPSPEECAAIALNWIDLTVGATNTIVGGIDATVLLDKKRVTNIGSINLPMWDETSDVSMLQLTLENGEPSAGLLTIPFHDELTDNPPPINPLELAFDPFTTWIRADDIVYAVDPLYPSAILNDAPYAFAGSLVQLPLGTAMSNVEDGQWRIAAYVSDDPAKGGLFEERVAIEENVAAVDPAGPGHFLVRHRSNDPPSLVRLECTNVGG
jgi:hypothetical protein